MAKKKKTTTKAPSGLSITRSYGVFVCSWKQGEKYDHQKFEYNVNGGAWAELGIGHGTTSKTLSWNIWQLYPYGGILYSVGFRVKGKNNKDDNWSAWSYGAYGLGAPYAPSVGMAPKSLEVATFSWSTPYADDSSANAFTVVEYQHQFTAENEQPSWNIGSVLTAAGEGALDVSETPASIATGSHSRWFRARARGMAGDSGWSVTRRVYATPRPAVIHEARATQDDSGVSGYIAYQTQPSAEYPIDAIDVEYVIVTPAADVSLPSGDLSWSNIAGFSVTAGRDAVSFSTGSRLEEDKAIFVRANTRHEDRVAYGTPTLLTTGYLSDPKNLAITDIDSETWRVTLQVSNESDIEDSFIVIRFKSKDEEFDTAVIPHGQNSVVVQCPPWGTGEISFGARAIVGSYSYTTRSSDNVRIYQVNEKMHSKNSIWEGGDFPVTPRNVTVSATAVSGSIRVGWEWSWAEARAAELSWADHMDAWESTDEPSAYTVSNIHASSWNIAGLEIGKTWYVRVRFIGGTSGAETYSPWSPIEQIDLSTAPAIPALTLSQNVITMDDTLTAYWSYITTDGKAQSYAEICEATIENGVITHGDVIAHTETAQHIDIDPKSVGWNAGESKNLCVRVVSGAGKSSRDWSAPVSVSIAEPIEAEITSTSLVHEEIIDNPQTFTGEIVTFESEDVVPVARHLKVALSPIQDLHGYDKPWSAGAGKNKFDVDAWIALPRQTNWYSVVDGVVSVNANDGSAITSRTLQFKPNTQYTISFTNPSLCRVFDDFGNTIAQTTSLTSASFTTTDSGQIAIKFYGSTYPTVIGKVQIELGSTATEWTPYSNICPISGRTEVETVVCGVNAWDEVWELGAIVNGADVATSRAIRSKNFCPILPNTQYYVKCAGSIKTWFYDSEKNWIGDTNYANQVFTTPNDARYFRFGIGSAYGTTYNHDISINYPSTDHDYHVYNGQTYTTALGRTVYGGTLDVVSGVLTVDRAMVTYNGSETWSLNSTGGITRFSTISKLADAKKEVGHRTPMISDSLVYAPSGNAVGSGFIYGTQSSAQLFVIAEQSIATVDAFKEWLSANPITIVYELATPQTYQLTPTEVALLKGNNNVWSDGEIEVDIADSVTEADVLKELPLRVTVTGAGAGGTTSLAVTRAVDYRIDRPDESEFNGYEGETISIKSQTGEDEIVIDSGTFDDGARYKITASVKDSVGQTSVAEKEFTVAWAHQAVVPDADIEMLEQGVAKITPKLPTEVPEGWSAEEGDTCDIYRLSADRPELIVKGAEFDTAYVDPFPTIGEFGGHRLVYRTKDGDYITEDNQIAWFDTGEDEGDIFESDNAIIDFNGEQVSLKYDIDVSNSWEKDFRETKYLGGSIQGDWNEGVRRTGSVSAATLNTVDQDTVRSLRRLANYAGICHIRTADGSSYPCNIEVSEDRQSDKYNAVSNFGFNVIRVDTEELDGITYEQWLEDVEEV